MDIQFNSNSIYKCVLQKKKSKVDTDFCPIPTQEIPVGQAFILLESNEPFDVENCKLIVS